MLYQTCFSNIVKQNNIFLPFVVLMKYLQWCASFSKIRPGAYFPRSDEGQKNGNFNKTPRGLFTRKPGTSSCLS